MTKKIKGKRKAFIISKGKVLERSNNKYKIKYKVDGNRKSDCLLCLWSLQRHRQKKLKENKKPK